MRQIFLFLSLTILSTSCSNPSDSDEPSDLSNLQLISDTALLVDSLKVVDSTTIDQEPISYAPFKVYSISTFGGRGDFNVSFISLTDAHRWREHPDSTIIDNKYLEEFNRENYNLHTIGKDKRALFLYQQGIMETDTVYIYFLKKDSLVKYAISDLLLKGMVTPYVNAYDFPVPEYYFMIVLDLETKSNEDMMKYMSPTLASISSSNPFNLGYAEQISFSEINEEFFPETDTSTRVFNYKQHYLYSNEEYDYYVKDRGEKHLSERQVIVIKKKDNKKVFDHWYLSGEGTEIYPFNLVNHTSESGIWTGEIFKSRPTVLMGLQSQSFGCLSIDILGLDEKPIYIHCDNRH